MACLLAVHQQRLEVCLQEIAIARQDLAARGISIPGSS